MTWEDVGSLDEVREGDRRRGQGIKEGSSNASAQLDRDSPRLSAKRIGSCIAQAELSSDLSSTPLPRQIREELSFSITQPIKHPERFEAMGLASAAGVLLYGPPGCGKTLVAKAVAADAGANFISIKGPELLNK